MRIEFVIVFLFVCLAPNLRLITLNRKHSQIASNQQPPAKMCQLVENFIFNISTISLMQTLLKSQCIHIGIDGNRYESKSNSASFIQIGFSYTWK